MHFVNGGSFDDNLHNLLFLDLFEGYPTSSNGHLSSELVLWKGPMIPNQQVNPSLCQKYGYHHQSLLHALLIVDVKNIHSIAYECL
jgi:hypothetical protein